MGNSAFWILTAVSLAVVSAIMITIAYLASDVPDAAEKTHKFRLRPDVLRVLAYGIVIVICLLATMCELHLMYSE